MLIACGILVNGPYCLITTAVSADLGNHPSLKGLETSFYILFVQLYKYVIRSWGTYIFFVKQKISVYCTISFSIHLYNSTIKDHLVITISFTFEVFRVIRIQDQSIAIENQIRVYSIHSYVTIIQCYRVIKSVGYSDSYHRWNRFYWCSCGSIYGRSHTRKRYTRST